MSFSAFACAHLVKAQRFTKEKVAKLSKKPEVLNRPQAAGISLSLVCVWISVTPALRGQVCRQHSFRRYAYNFVSRARRVHSLTGARSGIGSVVILLEDEGVVNTHGTYRTVPPDPPSDTQPTAPP